MLGSIFLWLSNFLVVQYFVAQEQILFGGHNIHFWVSNIIFLVAQAFWWGSIFCGSLTVSDKYGGDKIAHPRDADVCTARKSCQARIRSSPLLVNRRDPVEAITRLC